MQGLWGGLGEKRREIIKGERGKADIKKDVGALKEQTKTLFGFQKEQTDLAKSVHSMALSMEKMANEQGHMSSDIKGIRSDVDQLKSKPAKKWDAAVNKVTMAVLAAIVGFIMAKLGIV